MELGTTPAAAIIKRATGRPVVAGFIGDPDELLEQEEHSQAAAGAGVVSGADAAGTWLVQAGRKVRMPRQQQHQPRDAQLLAASLKGDIAGAPEAADRPAHSLPRADNLLEDYVACSFDSLAEQPASTGIAPSLTQRVADYDFDDPVPVTHAADACSPCPTKSRPAFDSSQQEAAPTSGLAFPGQNAGAKASDTAAERQKQKQVASVMERQVAPAVPRAAVPHPTAGGSQAAALGPAKTGSSYILPPGAQPTAGSASLDGHTKNLLSRQGQQQQQQQQQKQQKQQKQKQKQKQDLPRQGKQRASHSPVPRAEPKKQRSSPGGHVKRSLLSQLDFEADKEECSPAELEQAPAADGVDLHPGQPAEALSERKCAVGEAELPAGNVVTLPGAVQESRKT